VDPATGSLTFGKRVFDFARSDFIVDPQGTTEYFVQNIPLHFPPLEAWHVSGADLTQISFGPGDPSLPPGVTWPLAVDPTGNFLYGARGSAQDVSSFPLDLSVSPRNPDGSLSNIRVSSRSVCGTLTPLGNQIGKAVTAKGNRTFLYFTC